MVGAAVAMATDLEVQHENKIITYLSLYILYKH